MVMKMEAKEKLSYTPCQYTIEELEQYRDENGFIDLDKIQLEIQEGSRNQVGTEDIFKYWVDFAGTKVLLKQEKMIDNEENYTLYSELVMSELAHQMGVNSARTDLFKYQGFRGVMSFMAFDPEKQALMMTRELIGDSNDFMSDIDIFDFAKVENAIRSSLENQFGLDEFEIDELISERRKQLALQLYSCEMDNHTENEGFLFSRNSDGTYNVSVCPMFDNEHSFGLSFAKRDLENDGRTDRATDYLYTRPFLRACAKLRNGEAISNAESIANTVGKMNPQEVTDALMGFNSHRFRIKGNGKQFVSPKDAHGYQGELAADTTLYYMCQTDDMFDTATQFIKRLPDINMSSVIDAVERRIHAEIPATAKEQLTTFANMRRQALRFVVRGKMERPAYEAEAQKLIDFAPSVPLSSNREKAFNIDDLTF